MQRLNFSQIKLFLTKKRVFIPLVLVVIFLVFLLLKNKNNENVAIIEPSSGTILKTVQATGQVVSNTDLDLSFTKQGTVKSIKVAVGDKVKSGQMLASLESGSLYADVLSAKASVLASKAKLKKVLEGATSEEITIAEVALESAKNDLANTINTQNTLVKNAYRKLLNSTPEAEALGSYSVTAPTVSGFYNKDKEGYIDVNVYNTSGGASFSVSGLVNGTGNINTTLAQPLGDSGLSILFSSTTSITNTNWRIELPNKNASDYLANLNAYDSALKTQSSSVASAESLVREKEASLALKRASARPSEVELAEADVLSAEANLQKAQAIYEDSVIRAPGDGTITKVNLTYGEIIEAGKSAITLQDVENLYVEADINESNISSIELGQKVDILIDALPGRKFSGTIGHIDLSSDTRDGVVNYKIKVAISEKDVDIRPGMNAEINILILSKENVISLPEASIISRDGKTFVNVITNEKRKKYIEREVVIGIKGDGNMVEVLSGLSAGEKIALVSKK